MLGGVGQVLLGCALNCLVSQLVYPSRTSSWLCMQEEARALVESGVVELNLIAEDTNQYGMDR